MDSSEANLSKTGVKHIVASDSNLMSARSASRRGHPPEMDNDNGDLMADRNEKKDRKRIQNRVAQRLYSKYKPPLGRGSLADY